MYNNYFLMLPQEIKKDAPFQVRWRSFWSLSIIQSCNTLNEKGVQFVLIALGIWLSQELQLWFSLDLQYWLSFLIVLPFVLFSPLAGWLSDRFCKTRLLQAMVFVQIIVLAGMSAGFFMEKLWLAVGCFTIFCIQAVFFSPAKKGLVKDMVGTANIGFASGILEITSLLALLIGQIGALYLVYHLLVKWGEHAGWLAAGWISIFCCLAAIIVFILSLSVARFEPRGRVPFRISIMTEHLRQIKMLIKDKTLFYSQVGIGYFWFIGGVMMLISLQMAADVNIGNVALDSKANFFSALEQQKNSAQLIAWISAGSVIGGVLASIICAGKVRLCVAFVGIIGLTISAACLSIAEFGTTFFYLSLGGCGFMAAAFLVPLNALLQDSAPEDKRGDVIAAGNLVDCFLGILAVLLQGSMRYMGLSGQAQCGIIAIMSAFICFYIICKRPR